MIDKIISFNCTACHSCFSICPTRSIVMCDDDKGFKYPKVDYKRCINCKSCLNICPVLNRNRIKRVPDSYACYNLNEKIRLESSSGGIFSIMAESIIDKNGYVFGARFDDSFKVIHDSVHKKENLYKLRGSKYSQSQIDNSFVEVKNLLDNNSHVLFSGTPCQISGLKRYLRKEYEKLITVDLVCHGVPSPKVWQKYIEFREKKAGYKAKKINFRDKFDGWQKFSMLFEYHNDRYYRRNYNKDLYMKSFLSNVCLRPSCYDCHFKSISRESDITLADFWGINNILPEIDDDKGISLILINSIIGKNLFEEIKSDMLFKKVDTSKAIKYNSAAIKSVPKHHNRRNFFDDLDTFDFDVLVKKYCKDRLSVRIRRKINSVLKMVINKLSIRKN